MCLQTGTQSSVVDSPSPCVTSHRLHRYAIFLLGFAELNPQYVAPHTSRVLILDLLETRWVETTSLLRLDWDVVEALDIPQATLDALPPPEVHLEPTRRLPCRKDKHASCVHGDRVVLFGGWGPAPLAGHDEAPPFDAAADDPHGLGWHGELAVLDLTELTARSGSRGDLRHTKGRCSITWSFPHKGGFQPCPRAAATLTRVGDRAILFGGRSRAGRLNDVWELNLITMEWTAVAPCSISGPAPIARSWHSAEAIGDRIFIYGGLSKDIAGGGGRSLSDAWVLDVSTWSWTQLDVPTLAPDMARFWHTSCQIGSDILIVGGTHTDHDDYVPGVTPLHREVQACSLVGVRMLVPKLEAMCLTALRRAVAQSAVPVATILAAGAPRFVVASCVEYAPDEPDISR